MAASDDLTLRIRSRGGRAAARDVDETRKSVDRFGRSTRSTAKHADMLGKSTGLLFKPFRHLREEAFSLAKGVAAAGIAFGSVEGIKRSIETTDELVKTTVKLHNQFGLTTQSASGLAGVLQARGLDAAGLQMGFISLSRQLVNAEHGSKRAQGAFRILGINARGVHEAIGSKDGLAKTFETVVDRMTEMHGGARKAALGQQLLGRASRGLAPLLQEGALGLKQQLKWAKEFGVTLDDKTVGSVEDMAAAQTEAQFAMLGLQIQIGRFAAPLVAKANIALADIVRSFHDGHATGGEFSRTVFQLGMDLKPVGVELLKVGGYLKDHPRLIRAAVGAYAGLKLMSIPVAFGKGLAAGTAYGTGFRIGAGRGGAGGGPGGGGGVGGLFGGLLGGGGIGAASRLLGPRGLAGLPIRGPLGVMIAHELARHVLHSHNADPLDILNPESAGGPHDTIPKSRRGHGNIDSAVAYFRRHPRELTAAIVDSMSPGQRNALGVHTAPNAAGGEIVIHATLVMPDGKPIAKLVHREAIKRKSTG